MLPLEPVLYFLYWYYRVSTRVSTISHTSTINFIYTTGWWVSLVKRPVMGLGHCRDQICSSQSELKTFCLWNWKHLSMVTTGTQNCEAISEKHYHWKAKEKSTVYIPWSKKYLYIQYNIEANLIPFKWIVPHEIRKNKMTS